MRLHLFGLLGALSFTLTACGSATDDGSAASSAELASAGLPNDTDPSGAPYPIVLMHGMAGFGQLEVGPIGITYFKGIVEDLTRNGEAVYVTIAPPYASSEVRARAIATQIDEILHRTGKAKVNLVGHSQGGLDARVVASPNGLGYGDRIASVTTVSTPHRGSKIADLVLGLIGDLPKELVDDVTTAFLSLLQKTAYELNSDPALRDQLVLLSEKYMKDVFNPKYRNAPSVAYKSYAGRSNLRTGVLACAGSTYPNNPFSIAPAQPELLPIALFLEEGQIVVNDGLVTVDSAKWGTFEQCVPADHLQEVGHLGPGVFDHVALFRNIVERARRAGF